MEATERLIVVSYPNLSNRDAEWIAQLRREFSLLSTSTLAPHFTFVFPTSGIGLAELSAHLKKQLENVESIPFVLRCSMLVPDDSSDRAYVILVPDEGFSRIVKLHDSIYTGPLADLLRLDIPFIPHITVGYSDSLQTCKKVVDALNGRSFEITGTIDELQIIRRSGEKVQVVERLRLRGDSPC